MSPDITVNLSDSSYPEFLKLKLKCIYASVDFYSQNICFLACVVNHKWLPS